jgi:hypothetical protein
MLLNIWVSGSAWIADTSLSYQLLISFQRRYIIKRRTPVKKLVMIAVVLIALPWLLIFLARLFLYDAKGIFGLTVGFLFHRISPLTNKYPESLRHNSTSLGSGIILKLRYL